MSSVIEVPAAHKNLISPQIILSNASLIGLGHLGSDIAINLSKLGMPEIYLYDHDTVEERNLAGTPYSNQFVGFPKVEALKEILTTGSSQKRFIMANTTKVVQKDDLLEKTDFYIISTDSITSRLTIFEAITGLSGTEGYLIDLRSRAPVAEVYGVPLNDPSACFWYRQNLESKMSDPTPEIHCNEANIIQNTKFASAVATQILSDVFDGKRSLRYFRLNIRKFILQEMKLPVSEIGKEFDKKQKTTPCEFCAKLHRTKKTRLRCQQKHQESDLQEAETATPALPSREDLFR